MYAYEQSEITRGRFAIVLEILDKYAERPLNYLVIPLIRFAYSEHLLAAAFRTQCDDDHLFSSSRGSPTPCLRTFGIHNSSSRISSGQLLKFSSLCLESQSVRT